MDPGDRIVSGAGDYPDLKETLRGHRQDVRSGRVLLRHLESEGPFADSLHRHFGQVLSARIFVENRGPYETLKARELDLISSDSLRTDITKLYEFYYQAAEEGEPFD